MWSAQLQLSAVSLPQILHSSPPPPSLVFLFLLASHEAAAAPLAEAAPLFAPPESSVARGTVAGA